MCALFYDYRVQIPEGQHQVCCEWNESDAILAVGMENHEIHCYTDEVNRRLISLSRSYHLRFRVKNVWALLPILEPLILLQWHGNHAVAPLRLDGVTVSRLF